MTYAGLSRPASGVEHYFSHIWDMRGLEFGTPVSTHGIQCAIGALYAARLYNKIKNAKPDREKALRYVSSFDYEAYKKKLKAFLGKGADTMIALEKKEKKYDANAHLKRLEIINDCADFGINKALILIPHSVSKDAGMTYLCDFIQYQFQNINCK